MRYTDEVINYYQMSFALLIAFFHQGETLELCKWTVDLGQLPSFRLNAATPRPNGFYTGGSNLIVFRTPYSPARVRIRTRA
jgi:hypothetical protein